MDRPIGHATRPRRGATRERHDREGPSDRPRSASGVVVGSYWPCRPPWMHRRRRDPNALPCSRGFRFRSRSATFSRQRASCTVAARSGHRYRFVVTRRVLSWHPVARARPGQGTAGSAPLLSSEHPLQGLTPSPISHLITGPATARCVGHGHGDHGPLHARAVESCTVRVEGRTVVLVGPGRTPLGRSGCGQDPTWVSARPIQHSGQSSSPSSGQRQSRGSGRVTGARHRARPAIKPGSLIACSRPEGIWTTSPDQSRGAICSAPTVHPVRLRLMRDSSPARRDAHARHARGRVRPAQRAHRRAGRWPDRPASPRPRSAHLWPDHGDAATWASA